MEPKTWHMWSCPEFEEFEEYEVCNACLNCGWICWPAWSQCLMAQRDKVVTMFSKIQWWTTLVVVIPTDQSQRPTILYNDPKNAWSQCLMDQCGKLVTMVSQILRWSQLHRCFQWEDRNPTQEFTMDTNQVFANALLKWTLLQSGLKRSWLNSPTCNLAWWHPTKRIGVQHEWDECICDQVGALKIRFGKIVNRTLRLLRDEMGDDKYYLSNSGCRWRLSEGRGK